jgi:catechol 2,3-dioxygenase-like lactoylglutathione lyase family enzyme
VKPHIALISLGVKDFERAKRFYNEGLGWPIQQEQGDWACFSLGDDGSSALTLYPWDDFAVEAGLRPDGSGFRGVAFAYNVHSEERVDEVIAEAERGWSDYHETAEGDALGRLQRILHRPRGSPLGGRDRRVVAAVLRVAGLRARVSSQAANH